MIKMELPPRKITIYTETIATPQMTLVRENPCHHNGCLNHVTHPCEGCGFTNGVAKYVRADVVNDLIDEAVKASLGYM